MKVDNILIVDDSPEDRETIRIFLTEAYNEEGLTFRFWGSGTGEEGLAACRSVSPSCILLDYYLPDMTGSEFLARLKDGAGDTTIPVVMLTGSAKKSLALTSLYAGAQEYLPKRFVEPEMLFRAVQSAQSRFALLAGRRRSEAALASSEQMLRLSQEAGRIASYEHDLHSDELRWSAGSQAVIGLPQTSAAMPRSAWLAICHPDDLAGTITFVSDAYAQRVAFASYECRICRPDTGALRRIGVRFSVEYDAAGQPHRSNAAVMDVTDQHNDQASLRESRARLHSVVETAALGIIVADANGRISSVNTAGQRMFGYAREEDLIGRDLGVLMPDAMAAHRADATQRTVGALGRDQIGLHRDGSPFPIDLAVSSFGDGGPYFLTSIVRDATTHRAFEAERELYKQQLEKSNAELELLSDRLRQARNVAEEANRAKSRFLFGMSHELRTPLNGVIGHAHLLRTEGSLNSNQIARLDAMLESGKNLLEMITCILDLSEIEAGHLVLRPVRIDVRAIAAACLEVVRPLAERKGLTLRIDMAPAAPRELIADPIRLRQILLNLMGNAVKFTAQGTVSLHLRTVHNGSALRIGILDTGPGIAAEQRHRLFQEFDRLDIEATSKVEGAGLGLAISVRLANLMGGALGQDNNPGGGSLFWLELPLDLVAVSPAAMTSALDVPAAVVALAPGRTLHVLVVDDILINRDIAGAYLRAAGHQVTCVDGGVEAVAAAASIDFDVILMDVRMPEMDGLEATRRIRSLAGLRGRVPIVALTAQAFSVQVAECLAAGMNSHLGKPFDPDMLITSVVRAVTVGQTSSEGLHPLYTPKMPATESAANGLEPPVFDRTVFERTAVYLAPEAVASYLKTITEGCERLLRGLHEPHALTHSVSELAAEAHTLAGSAGMFGFERLANLGRRFERATQSGAAEAPALADGLGGAIEASLRVVQGILAPVNI